MKFFIPTYVRTLLDILEENNFEAFIVGGSVRDTLLGLEPTDYDIATNAHPQEMEEIFKDFKVLLVGKEFGTIVVVQSEGKVEITTYRIEEEYIDGRRPSSVSFSMDIIEDLKRRDFTINSMAYSEKTGLVDPFGGRDDLEKKTIRTVGDPKERFLEDHLRILRAVRFTSSLSFEIEDETLRASKEMSCLLGNISAERVREELFKILLSDKPSVAIKLLYKLDILDIIIPELIDGVGFKQKNPHHELDVFNHILCVVDASPPVIELRLAALFHDIAKPRTFSLGEDGIGHFYGHQNESEQMAEKILRRLKASNSLIQSVKILVKDHMTQHNNYGKKGLKRLINRVGKERIHLLLDLQYADMKCTSKDRDTSLIDIRRKEIKEIIEENEPVDKKQLAIDGNDVVELGYKKGRIIGEILDFALEIVLEDPMMNKREILVKAILEKFNRETKIQEEKHD